MQENWRFCAPHFYLPALTGNSSTQKKSREVPLLLQALSEQTDTLTVDTTITIAGKKEASPILKNLRGTLKVKILRNTWFKSENMRVEIGGDIDIIKNSDFFELFGPIEISGSIRFPGAPLQTR